MTCLNSRELHVSQIIDLIPHYHAKYLLSVAPYSGRMEILHVSGISSFLVVCSSQTFRAGEGHVTIFASQSISGTFNYVVHELFYDNRDERLNLR